MHPNPQPHPRPHVPRALRTAAALALALLTTLTLAQQPPFLPANTPTSQTRPATYPPFTDLPNPTTQPLPQPSTRTFAPNPGTPGLTLPNPAHHANLTIALLGDLAPTNEASATYLQRAVNELNLLRPDLVLTLGNLIDGLSRSGPQYAQQAAATRAALDHLTMPWYPCVGDRDILSGTLDPADLRFAELYQKYFGPRYYSLDCGELHILILDSEEPLATNPNVPAPRGISDTQAAWVKADLARTFEACQATSVLVALHRPLWREPTEAGPNPSAARGGWNKIHELLTDFNHKPIVRVEGPDTPPSGTALRGPKILGVFAAAQRAYDQEPARDGIPYYILGSTAAILEQDASVLLRHYSLLRVDAAASTPHLALIQMGASTTAPATAGILPADAFLADERAILTRLAALDEKSLDLAGALEQPLGKDAGTPDSSTGALRLILANPLPVPIDVQLRLASTRNLATPTLRENANPYTENFDSPWELFTPHAIRHLEPGASERFAAALFCKQQTAEILPPQVEFLIHWNDSRGRTHTVILKRRIPVIPAATVPVAPLVKLDTELGWQTSAHGSTYSWTPSVYERQKRSPDWEMTADAQFLYLRIRADDNHPSYSPDLTRPDALLSDAVAIAWAPTPDAAPAAVQRIVMLPFAPGHTPQLLTNTGVGRDQTPLLALDIQAHPVQVHILQRKDAWEATLAIPRAAIFGAGGTTYRMNIAVHDNDGGAETFVRSWAKEEPGPALWGRLTLITPPAATTRPVLK